MKMKLELVPVPVALISAAESEKVIALQHGDVVAEVIVVAVPEAGSDALRIYVVWNERQEPVFAPGLQSGSKLRELQDAAGIGPGPEVTKVAEVKVISGIGSDIGGQAGYEEPRLLRANGLGRHGAQLVAGEKSTHVDLIVGRSDESIVTITAIKVPLCPEVVVDPSHSKIRPIRNRESALEADNISSIAAAAV